MVETAIVGADANARRPTDLTQGIGPELVMSATPLTADFERPVFPGGQSVIIEASDRLTSSMGQVPLINWIRGWWTAPTLVQIATVPSAPAVTGTSALHAADALANVFGLPMEAIAEATGIGRTTIINWRRTGAIPRPSTVRQLWRLYGIAMAVRSVMTVEGARAWLHTGTPSPLALLRAGDLEAFEQRAARLAFDPRPDRYWRPGVLTEVETDAGQPVLPAARASRSRTRMGRLR